MRNQKFISMTIFEALGGQAFLKMSKAQNLMPLDEGGLQFDLPAGRLAGGINRVKIALNAADGLFDMVFLKMDFRNGGGKQVEAFNGVQEDELRSAFSDATGLELRVPGLGRKPEPVRLF